MTTRERGKEPKAGVTTSEFIVAAGVIVIATILALFGRLDAEGWNRWVEVVKWAGGGYVVSRGLAKINS